MNDCSCTTAFELLNFLLKTDFSRHQIFPLLSKIWYSKWPLWSFFEFGMTFNRTTTFEPWTLNFWTFNFQTFYSKQTSRYIKFFHCFPKFDTRSDHYWTFLNVECWIWNDCSYTTTLNLEVFSDGWVIATKEQSYRSHTGKLDNENGLLYRTTLNLQLLNFLT